MLRKSNRSGIQTSAHTHTDHTVQLSWNLSGILEFVPGLSVTDPIEMDPWVHFWHQNCTGVGPILTHASKIATSDRHASNPVAKHTELWVHWAAYICCCSFAKCYLLQPYRVVDSYCINSAGPSYRTRYEMHAWRLAIRLQPCQLQRALTYILT